MLFNVWFILKRDFSRRAWIVFINARIIKQAMTTAYTYGKANAAKEIGTQAPANLQEVLQQIDIQADAIAEQQIARITGESKTPISRRSTRANLPLAALAAADQAAEEAIDEYISDASEILMSRYINHSRNDVFDQNSDDI
jgi:hypothetical protein